MIDKCKLYNSEEFVEKYTYIGNDLGATWTKEYTNFKVWAPTASKVQVALYTFGTAGTDDLIKKIEMESKKHGVWSAVAEGDLHGVYYTYIVTREEEEVEACDPYARTTGVNGHRAMVINLESTNPEGWEKDKQFCKELNADNKKDKQFCKELNVDNKGDKCFHEDLNTDNPGSKEDSGNGMNYTDAVIYELHIRDFSIDESSGISEKHRGKFLAFTEVGTKTAGGVSTGIDYLTSLGITHLHILPMYDFGSVDETSQEEQYNWGYDPVNFNVPEGFYSTDPYHGEVRVREMKQMIKALHDHNISVVMDVVYNHVYDAGSFCFNKIVPGYFSRFCEDGSYSNGTYCGNDTASERAMVSKYIADSVMYWAEEYHIDGFRFDLVGLIDLETMKKIVDTVHKKYPDILFYGEGWDMPTAIPEECKLTIQKNAHLIPEFAFFSDNIRDLLGGRNGETLGFAAGLEGCEELVKACFMAQTPWCPNPAQTVNYISCHDDYTFMDKLRITRPEASQEELIAMNKLAAAIYILSQGIPFIHAGEEFLRIKKEEDGSVVKNSYKSSDYVNKLRWSHLEDRIYADVAEYYKGLIQFRKAYAQCRMVTKKEVEENIYYKKAADGVLLFEIKGKKNIIMVFNAAKEEHVIDLPETDSKLSQWKVCINGEKAGVEVLSKVSDGKVSVMPVSALVLVEDN